MEKAEKASILRIFISSTDKFKHIPLYETIVFAAKRNGLAGATVLKGVMGYGSSNRISSQNFWEISEKMPLVIEIIDEAEKIPTGCLITVEKAKIVLHKKGNK